MRDFSMTQRSKRCTILAEAESVNTLSSKRWQAGADGTRRVSVHHIAILLDK
jgi:hypothetical protein